MFHWESHLLQWLIAIFTNYYRRIDQCILTKMKNMFSFFTWQLFITFSCFEFMSTHLFQHKSSKASRIVLSVSTNLHYSPLHPFFPPKKHLKIILCVVNSEVFTGSHTIYDSYLEMKGNIWPERGQSRKFNEDFCKKDFSITIPFRSTLQLSLLGHHRITYKNI